VSKYQAIITDIECDNLYEKVTKFHCATVMDLETGEYEAFRPWEWSSYLDALYQAKYHANHNIIGFDFPTLTKLFGFKWNRKSCYDTLVVSRAIFPDRPGGHSLKALGESLGLIKGDFGETNDWSTFTEDMMSYNIQDCFVARGIALRQLKQLGTTIEEVLDGSRGD
jgi:hypothetical protein